MTQHPDDHRKLWLEQLVKDKGLTLGAEIGVHEGVTHFHLLDKCPSLTMVGVDIYRNKQAHYWPAVQQQLQKYGIRSRFYKMDTVEAAANVGTGELDFVFIDADHKYHNVIRDITAWAPKVRKGGYVTGHDCEHPDVKRALAEYFGENSYQTAQDEVWYLQK